MKFLKQFSLLLTALFLFSAFSIDGEKTYVGKWKGKDQGEIGFLTLTEDNYAIFEFNGQIVGGKSYNSQGVDASMKYTVDTSSEPYKIDFIILDNSEGEELGRLKGIIKMNNRNEMEMAMTFGGGTERPTDFSVDNITFSRYK
ncbi:MAG: hypothetical protein EVB11_12105 [Winogradskyella sp.]|nr:MAG: hypothetical protein EVB11_12105 [Winogradskyella sp.]